jgi:hypothetical protein
MLKFQAVEKISAAEIEFFNMEQLYTTPEEL